MVNDFSRGAVDDRRVLQIGGGKFEEHLDWWWWWAEEES